MNMEVRLKEMLLPVFGLDSVNEIRTESSLVTDLGADSLDFVEITYLIEREFGVVLKASEVVVAGASINTDELFVEGKLTEHGSNVLKRNLSGNAKTILPGMTKADLFQSITVGDLCSIIRRKMEASGIPC